MATKKKTSSKDATPAVQSPISMPSHLAGMFAAPTQAPVETGATNYAPRVVHFHPMSPQAPAINDAAVAQGLKGGVELGAPVVQANEKNTILDPAKAAFYLLSACYFEYLALRQPMDSKKETLGVLTSRDGESLDERDAPSGDPIRPGCKWSRSVIGGMIVVPEPGDEPIACTFRQDKARATGYSQAAQTIHRLSRRENQSDDILALAGADIPPAFYAYFQWGIATRAAKGSGREYVVVSAFTRHTSPGETPFVEVVKWLNTQEAKDSLQVIQDYCEREKEQLLKIEESTRQALDLD